MTDTPATEDAAAEPQTPESQTTPETQGTEGDQTPARPDWLPEKFQTPEELAKSYAELETKLSEAPKGDPNTLDFDGLSKEFADTGTLTEESIEKLMEHTKLPRDFVNTYLDGYKALQTQKAEAIYAAAGGQEDYDAAIRWATEHMGDAEKKALNDALDSDSVEYASLAVSGLMARYRGSGVVPPRMIDAAGGAGGGDGGYDNLEQFKADCRNPLYQTDPDFRKNVEHRLAATKGAI